MYVDSTEMRVGFGFGKTKNYAQKFDGEVIDPNSMGPPSINVNNGWPAGQNHLHGGREVSRHISEEVTSKGCGTRKKGHGDRFYIWGGSHECNDESREVEVTLSDSAGCRTGYSRSNES